MTLFRMFVLMGAVLIIGFFAWPWIDSWVAHGGLSGEVTLHAGNITVIIPTIVGVFATLGLAAMLWTVRRD